MLLLRFFLHVHRPWVENDIEGRLPNGILGLIVRDKFPRLVTFEGREEPAFTWKHYQMVPDLITDPQRQSNNLFERVEEDFWVKSVQTNRQIFMHCLIVLYFPYLQHYFRWAENTEHHARRVVHNVTKDLIYRMFYEGRIQSVISYYRNVFHQKIDRKVACRIYLTVEQYMQVCCAII
jgi:hypothetical protein